MAGCGDLRYSSDLDRRAGSRCVMSRRHKLEAMLVDEPLDQTLRYMLALELEKEGDYDRSLTLLAGLQADVEPYVPSFLMAGQQLTRLGRIDEARSAFRSGIVAAGRSGDDHAESELGRFLEELD